MNSRKRRVGVVGDHRAPTTSTQRTRASLRGVTSELLVAPQQGSGDESELKNET